MFNLDNVFVSNCIWSKSLSGPCWDVENSSTSCWHISLKTRHEEFKLVLELKSRRGESLREMLNIGTKWWTRWDMITTGDLSHITETYQTSLLVSVCLPFYSSLSKCTCCYSPLRPTNWMEGNWTCICQIQVSFLIEPRIWYLLCNVICEVNNKKSTSTSDPISAKSCFLKQLALLMVL